MVFLGGLPNILGAKAQQSLSVDIPVVNIKHTDITFSWPTLPHRKQSSSKNAGTPVVKHTANPSFQSVSSVQLSCFQANNNKNNYNMQTIEYSEKPGKIARSQQWTYTPWEFDQRGILCNWCIWGWLWKFACEVGVVGVGQHFRDKMVIFGWFLLAWLLFDCLFFDCPFLDCLFPVHPLLLWFGFFQLQSFYHHILSWHLCTWQMRMQKYQQICNRHQYFPGIQRDISIREMKI